MVEKIKRDVRITRIYEGTSEIMEITIARGRWQEHLKSGGELLPRAGARARRAARRGLRRVGADVAALAYHALAELMERCRTEKLTRNQHILMRLGALIALRPRAPRRSPGARIAPPPSSCTRRHPSASSPMPLPRQAASMPATSR